ncbi:MAG: hypothetical protein LBV12_07020 [Puniceicoccales bacterium]|nr:hypothetical protein [Puniceicoccales bacterium]
MRLSSRSLEVETLTFRANQNIDDDPLFAFDGELVFRVDDLVFFRGRVTDIERTGTAETESVAYTVSNAWYDLEHLVFEQKWRAGKFTKQDPDEDDDDVPDAAVPEDKNLTRLLLGYSVDGERMASDAVIREVLAYAINVCQVALQIGGIEATLQIPSEDVTDLTCAEVIQRVLRWHPACVTVVDYATAVPTLHIRKRDNGEQRTLDYKSQLLEIPSLRPCYEQKAAGVRITYTRLHTAVDSNGEPSEWKEVIERKWPADITGHELRCVRFTIELQGSQSTSLVQKLKTGLIRHESDEWWKDHLTWLKDKRVKNFVLLTSGVTPEDLTKKAYRREVLEGAIAPWMNKPETPATVWAQVNYTVIDGDFEETRTNQRLECNVRTTTASSGTYQVQASSLAAEDIPVGLEKDFYEQINTLQYQGTVALANEDWDGRYWVGTRLNLTGLRPEWETMDTMVQGMEVDIDAGAVTLTVGPATWLAPGDFIDLTRGNRNRMPTANLIAQRKTGKSGTDKNSEIPSAGVRENTALGAGGQTSLRMGALVLANSAATGFASIAVTGTASGAPLLAIWPSHITKGMWVQEATYTDGDGIYKANFLMSTPERTGDFVCDCCGSDTPDPGGDTTDVPTSFSVLNQQ